MDVWTDDVLRDVLRESRRRRRLRRRIRVTLVTVAWVTGVSGGIAVASWFAGFPGPEPVATALPPVAAEAPPAPEPDDSEGQALRALPALRPEVPLPALVESLLEPPAMTPIRGDDADGFVDTVLALLPLPPAASSAVSAAGAIAAELAELAVQPVIEDALRPGDTLISSLSRHGIANSTVAVIARELRAHFDFRRARPGQRYRIERDAQGSLVAFRYQVSDHEHYELKAGASGWETKAARSGILRQQARLAGVVSTTLYDAVEDLGEKQKLAADLAGIFAWEFDFAKSVRPGDEFQILYERNYAPRLTGGDLRYIGPGRILAARYKSGARSFEAVYYETAPGRGAYYRSNGDSVRQAFLAAPVNYARITSSFSTARFHPILRVNRPHPGIDYAAPAGTPVWAVASGRVSHVGWLGGYGRLVKIQHAGGYESYYAHLSSWARGLRVGDRVDQKQVIGYVGSSGLSTGPHVCFRITKNGSYVNPASTRIPSGDRVPERRRQEFETVRDARLAQLGPAVSVATDEAM